ncbi:hypothetical protein KQI41_17690 [Tissierella pigra]|uniref:hypothetical protein n=1 Tax=Tissierella pigra TaxID=2607614 RepID=UPI001C104712|nr:hypothetical protein [Tissierella pigra]MBU5428229.1 hypothetical protein [Tissierella pigra]
MKRTIFFLLYSLVSIGILLLALMNNTLLHSRIFLLTAILFLGVGLINHFYEISKLNKESGKEKRNFAKDDLKILIGSTLSATITWYINHEMGYGAVVANGFIGVLAATLFTPKLAGIIYTASFIGMSSQTIIATMPIAGFTGFIAGMIIILSKDIYVGFGGKGGTSMALSTQLVRLFLSIFRI